MRVRIKGVIGAGVSGSKGERPGTVNVLRVAAAVSRKYKSICCAQGTKEMVVRERIATARERIAKLREAEKMVGVRYGAEGSGKKYAQADLNPVRAGIP